LKARWPEVRAITRRALIGVVFFHPAFFDYLRFAMSETLFMLLATSSILVLDKAKGERSEGVNKHLVLAGSLAGAAMLTRSIGVSVVMAGVLWSLLFLRPRKKALYFAIPAVVPYLLWVLYSHQLALKNEILLSGVELYGYYLGYWVSVADLFESMTVVFFQNVISFADSIARLLSFYSFSSSTFSDKPVLAILIAAGGVALLLGGFYRSFRARGLEPYLLFVSIYLAMILFWPYEPLRFIVVLIPWFFLMIGEVFRAASKRWSFLCHGALPLVMVLAGLGLWGNSKFYQQDISEFGLYTRPLDLRESVEVLAWMRDNLPEKAIVATTDPELLYHQSGRIAVPAFNEGNLIAAHYPDRFSWEELGEISESQKQYVRDQRKSVWGDWKTLGVTHVWDDDTLSRFPGAFALKGQTRGHAGKLGMVYSKPGSRVYRLNGGKKGVRKGGLKGSR